VLPPPVQSDYNHGIIIIIVNIIIIIYIACWVILILLDHPFQLLIPYHLSFIIYHLSFITSITYHLSLSSWFIIIIIYHYSFRLPHLICDQVIDDVIILSLFSFDLSFIIHFLSFLSLSIIIIVTISYSSISSFILVPTLLLPIH